MSKKLARSNVILCIGIALMDTDVGVQEDAMASLLRIPEPVRRKMVEDLRDAGPRPLAEATLQVLQRTLKAA